MIYFDQLGMTDKEFREHYAKITENYEKHRASLKPIGVASLTLDEQVQRFAKPTLFDDDDVRALHAHVM